jgi:hypothetical protein
MQKGISSSAQLLFKKPGNDKQIIAAMRFSVFNTTQSCVTILDFDPEFHSTTGFVVMEAGSDNVLIQICGPKQALL